MGRSDSYQCGLMAHSHRRPALTNASRKPSPCPELRSLPSPALPVQQLLAATRHARYDGMDSGAATEE